MIPQIDSDGYEAFRTESGSIYHHRLLLWAWGDLDSPWFSDDLREVHHEIPIEWLNTEENLRALYPWEHIEEDAERAKISTPWDDLREIHG